MCACVFVCVRVCLCMCVCVCVCDLAAGIRVGACDPNKCACLHAYHMQVPAHMLTLCLLHVHSFETSPCAFAHAQNRVLPERHVYAASLAPFLSYYAVFAAVLYPLASHIHPTHLLNSLQTALPKGVCVYMCVCVCACVRGCACVKVRAHLFLFKTQCFWA